MQNMKFPRDVQDFRDELDDLRNEGWTAVCLEGLWPAKRTNNVFTELLGRPACCFPEGRECLNPL